jgi:D-amino-acid oxidase
VISQEMDVVVIGAGVSGLTTAVCLAERGLSVTVRARELPSETHSIAAGAMWGPYLASHERVTEWSRESLAVLKDLANESSSGVAMLDGIEVSRTDVEPPDRIVELGYVECPTAELPKGFLRGWRYAVPVADMPVYLEYLQRRFRAAGGRIMRGVATSLETVAPSGALVVNCTGIGARELVDDPAVIPVRGQLVVVENPGIKTFFGEYLEDTAEPTYFLPHGDHVVLGSTVEPGRADTEDDAAAAAAIVRRCAEVEPALFNARVLGYRVGIRPSRSEVRVERVRLGARHVIHNYGHGGSGFSLSWGCAQEVVDLALAARQL